jgi:hypothetical protein
MPLTPRQTHPGIPLHSEARGGGLRETVGEIPPEFRAALDLEVLQQPVPYDTEIPFLSDTILSTRVEQDFTSESKLIQVTKPPGVVTLVEAYTDKFKQSGTRTRNFRPITDLPLIGLPSATRDVNTKNLGNYHFIEDIEDSGTLFTQQVFSVERPDSAPEHFKELLPLITESHLELGIAAMPVLIGSEYKKSEGQQDVFTKKVDRTYRDPIAFPATLGSFRMTPEQQIATGLDTLDDNPLNIAEVDAETVEARSEDLGDGTWYKTKYDVPVVFGKEQFSRERQILGAIPAEFRVGIETVTVSDEEAGIAVAPGPLTGTVEKISQEQTTEFKRKIETRSLDLDPTAIHTDFKMTPEQQLESLTINLTDIEPTPSVITATTVEEEIKTLGGDLWLVTEGTVPDVFGKEVFSRERQILGAIPAEFRVGIQTITTSNEEAGIAADPGVLTGTVEQATQQQVTEYKRKVETKSLDLDALATFTNYKMTPDQQLESLTIELTDVPPTPSTFTALTVESEIKTLGGGLFLATEGTVPDVFDKHLYSEERDLLGALPAEFRAGVDRVTESFETAGIAAPPTLIAGQEFGSEQQITEFRKKVEARSLDFSAIATLPGEELTELYGGGALTTSKQVDDLPLSVSGGYLVTEGRAQAIGGGLFFKELKTRDATPWPLLYGQQYDERLDVVLPFTQQVKDASTITIGVAKTDIDPVDMWRSKARTVDTSAIATVLNAYSLSYPSKINVELPDLLVSVDSLIEQSTGEGASSEDGTHVASGSFSVSQSLRASSQSSVNLATDLQIVIKQFWGNNIDCTHYHFFLPQPVTPAAVLAKVNALVPGTVVAWPKFNPKIVNISAIGQRASLQVVATSGGSLASSSSGSSSTASGGTGYSRELGLNLQTIRISPTIHPIITVGGTTTDTETITAHADSTSDLSLLYEIDQTQDVTASVNPTSIPATVGATTWPASGIFLYRVDAQPYRYGYVQFHVIIVDAASFPYN